MLRWAWPAFSAEQVARFPLLLLAQGAGALGWSQAKLAREAGFDKRSIIRYELGLVAPSIRGLHHTDPLLLHPFKLDQVETIGHTPKVDGAM